jgi:hypothetical protein
VDWTTFVDLDFRAAVDCLAEQVEDAAERLLADWDGDRAVRVGNGNATGKAVGRVHCDCADAVIAELLLHFADQRFTAELNSDGVVNLGQRARERRLNDDSLDLFDASCVAAFRFHLFL